MGNVVVAGLGETPVYCAFERAFDFFLPGSDLQSIATIAIRDHLMETAHLGQGYIDPDLLGIPDLLSELVETFGAALALPGLATPPRGHFPFLAWLPQNGNAPSRHFASLEGLSVALIHKLDEAGTCVVASTSPVFMELLAPAAVANNRIQTVQYRPFFFQQNLQAFDREAELGLEATQAQALLSGIAVDHDKPH